MIFLIYVLLGFVPSILWLAYFRKLNYVSPEPWGQLIMIMIFGGFSVVMAGILEAIVFAMVGLTGDESSVIGLLASHTFIVGVIEEGVKFLVVFLFIFFSPKFSEPIDGLVYSCASAIGFSLAENALYAMSFGLGNFLLRAMLATFGHIMFSSIWGYELGQYKNDHRGQGKALILSIMIAALAHGIYNTLVSIDFLLPVGVLFVSVVLWRFIRVSYKKAILSSVLIYQMKLREKR